MIGRFFETYINVVRKVLPSPFTIALILSALTLLSVLAYGSFTNRSSSDIIIGWANGLWEPNLMVFAMQMMLMLVLGHVLANVETRASRASARTVAGARPPPRNEKQKLGIRGDHIDLRPRKFHCGPPLPLNCPPPPPETFFAPAETKCWRGP